MKDRQALASLYQLTSANLYGVILRILIREDWAQECLQEAYIKIWQRADSYRPEKAAPITWMMTIARNQALDLLRRQRKEVGLDSIPEQQQRIDQAPLPLEQMLKQDESQALAECLKGLNEQSRQTIAMAYLRGLTHEQMAEQLNTPLGTIKTWIRRGLQQLKRCLES
ncbi:MAG: sigma-70 family RNA polymerase sigma factor [Chromatiales bacterium]|nr:sigma-70 family RNA polymerase sigma factor [Chromatiales bacterium]